MLPTDVQRIQFRSDTLANWIAHNPVLAVGEPAYETDTGKVKYGNGIDAWLDLPYAVGAKGDRGPEGPEGPEGPPGSAGSAGDPGLTGAEGPAGPANALSIGTVTSSTTPSATITGNPPSQTLNLVLAKGDQGNQGLPGIQGIDGAEGPAGQTGPAGPAGPTGPQGPKGDAAGINLKGVASQWPPSATAIADDLWILPSPLPVGTPAGFAPGDGALYDGAAWLSTGPIRGPQGLQGATGPAGSTGPRGFAGPTGPTGPQGVQGATGPAGSTGPAGPANTLSVGVVSALQPNQHPVVQIDGNSPYQSISFGIPTPYLPTLAIGTVTEGSTPSAQIKGTPPDFVLDLVLPQGAPPLPPDDVGVWTTQPNAVSAHVGDTVRLTAVLEMTSGSSVGYQWQKNTSGTWSNISNATSSAYSFVPNAPSGPTDYRCVGTSLSGWTGNSNTASVTVSDRSTDPGGEEWVQVDLSGIGTVSVSGRVSFAGGYFFTHGGVSSDGLTWTNIAGDPIVQKEHVIYGNGVYMDGVNKSTDGRYWSAGGPPGTGPIRPVGLASDWPNPPSLAFGLGGGPSPGIGKFLGHWVLYNGTTTRRSTVDGITFEDHPWFPNLISSGCYLWFGADAGYLKYSFDGVLWQNGTGDFYLGNSDDAATNVRFAYSGLPGEKYMAILPGLFVWTSKDGIAWTKRTLPFSGNWSGIAYQNGVWMAIAEGSAAYAISTDGVTWVRKTFPAYAPYRLAAGNCRFLATNSNLSRPQFLLSADGDCGPGEPPCVAPGPGDPGYTPPHPPALSDPLWNSHYRPIADGGIVSFGGNYFFSQRGYSSDGASWTASNGPSTDGNKGHVAHGNGLYFDGRYISTDGVSWTPTYPRDVLGLINSHPPSLAFGLGGGSSPGVGKFLAVYRGAPVSSQAGPAKLYSTVDGVTFTNEVIYGPPAENLETFMPASGALLWFGSAAGQLVYSSNGINWANAEGYSLLGTNLESLRPRFAFSQDPTERFVAIVPGSFVWTSQNGVTWTRRELPTSGIWCGIAYGNGRWMAVAKNSTTYVTSEDGIYWTAHNNLPYPANELAYGNANFTVATLRPEAQVLTSG